jgi:hypothetical protein
LSSFASLVPSPYDASISDGTVALNEIDAAVALLSSDFAYRQAYLDGRVAAAPADVAIAAVGERVHKVGRTTGLTFGTIKQVGVVVGPIGYAPGPCWFRQCLLIETDDGKPFSDHGDSGSAVVGDDGKVVGLLFAGNDTQTYACAIQNVLDQLNCRIA